VEGSPAALKPTDKTPSPDLLGEYEDRPVQVLPSRNLASAIPEATGNDYTFYIKNDVSPFAFVKVADENLE
jgi:hypothetical protein